MSVPRSLLSSPPAFDDPSTPDPGPARRDRAARASRPRQVARPAGPLLISDVRLEQDAEAARVSIVVRDGRIAQILPAGTPPPAGLRRIEGDGALCLPAFVDAFTRAGCATPEPVVDRDLAPDTKADVALGMREANRKGLQPAFRAVDILKFEDEVLEGFRAQGFGVLHSSPDEELLAGQSTLVTSGPAALRDRVLQAVVGQSAGLRSRGRGYPSTLMGSMAQLRQFFLDAGLHERRMAAPALGRREPYDADLDVGARLLAGAQRVWARADSRDDIERWLGLAQEFGLRLVIVGGRDAWMLADRLKAAEIPVVLTLDWGKEPKDPAKDAKPKEPEPESDAAEGEVDEGAEAADESAEATEAPAAAEKSADGWIYEEPFALRVEHRREWERHRDGVLRLAEAGVAFAFDPRATRRRNCASASRPSSKPDSTPPSRRVR